MTEIQKAKVAIIRLTSDIEFEGLMLPDGSFAVATAQVARILGLNTKNVSLSVKRKLNLKINLPKIKTELNSNPATIINLEQFQKYIVELALQDGNPIAKNLSKILVGLSLNQVFCDYFDIKFDKEDRKNWLLSRSAGKKSRRDLTDVIKDYAESNEIPRENEHMIYAKVTNQVYKAIFGRTATQLKKDWNCKNPRDNMTEDELRILSIVEYSIMNFYDKKELPFFDAVDTGIDCTAPKKQFIR